MTDVLGTRIAGGEQLVGELVTGFDVPAELRYPDIANSYALSEFGVYHAQQNPRYANRYAYEREAMLADLGDDVHPVKHMHYTDQEVVVPIILSQNDERVDVDERFDEVSAAVVRTAALVHDIGECEHPGLQEVFGKTVGDVSFWEKTAQHEGQEAAIRTHIYSAIYTNIPKELLFAVEGVVTKTEQGFSTEVFAFAEHVGYLETHNRAARLVCSLAGTAHEETDRFQQLLRLSRDSFVLWHERISAERERFAYAGQVVARTMLTVQSFETTFG